MAVPDTDPSPLLVVTSVIVGVSDDGLEELINEVIVDSDDVTSWSTEQ